MHSLLYRILAGVVMLVSFYCATYFSEAGFKAIQEFKQLERIVPSSIIGLMSGEAQVHGFVQSSGRSKLPLSTRQKVPSVYFYYLKEEKSDGGWSKVESISRSVDFTLVDYSSFAHINVRGSHDRIRWSMKPSYTETRGDYRFTEWRIEPDQWARVYGWAEISSENNSHPEVEIGFNQPGDYLPIISRLSAKEVRGSLGTDAILYISAGISLFALGVCAFMYLIQVHRLLIYLSVLTLFTSGALVHYGIASLELNVRGGANFLNDRQKQTEETIKEILIQDNLGWPGLENLGPYVQSNYSDTSWQSRRIKELRMNLHYLREVYLIQIARFTESTYAYLNDLDDPENVSFFNAEHNHEAEQRIAKHEQTAVFQTRFIFMAIAGFVVFSVMTYFGFRFAKIKRLIENIPTSKTKGVSFGITELKGKVVPYNENFLTSPVSYAPCVWYRYLIQEKRRSGKNSSWVTISDEIKGSQFHCEDNEGQFLIDASNAQVITRHKKVSRQGSMRYTEWSLNPGDALYAIGQSIVDPNKHDQLLLSQGKKNEDIFILSNYSEREVMIRKAATAMLALACAFSGIFFFATFLNGMNGQFSAVDYFISGLLGPVFLIGFTIVLHYNDIVFLKQRAERNWANIQVSLKKRADLFKQLQPVVKKYLSHEKELLTELAKLRRDAKKTINTTSHAKSRLNAEQHFMEALDVKIEAYPELQSDAVVRDFSETMIELENEIALMRQGFNDAVNYYNTRIQSFPDILLSRLFKFKKKTRLYFNLKN